MKIKTCWRKEIDLTEGDYIENAVADMELEPYDVSGVVILSLGIIVDSEGGQTQITDLKTNGTVRKATEEEVKKAIETLNYDDYLIFEDIAPCARKYIKDNPEDEIIAIKYNAFGVKSKEELLNVIECCEC